MSTSVRFRRMGLAATLAMLSCGGPPKSRAPSPSDTIPQKLEFSASTAEHLAGLYTYRDTKIQFEFEQTPTLKRFVIRDANGNEVLSQERTGDHVTTRVLNGQATTIVNLAILRESARLASLPESERTFSFDPHAGVIEDGDMRAFQRFNALPEAVAVPWLSRELGIRGFNGRDYPMTGYFHVVASKVVEELNLTVPAWTQAEKEAYGKAVSYCDSIESDPNGDNCFGMCGPGCNCWPSTCGDCCCHDGCKSHDWTCRNCHWYTPWNCLLCATFSSFLDGACGDSCQGQQYGQPCSVEPGQDCSQGCECNGRFDGSSESGAAPEHYRCRSAQEFHGGWFCGTPGDL